MVVELEVITDIYKATEEGEQKLVKKGCTYSKQFETNHILVENFVNERGRVVKKYCVIKQDGEYFKINKKFEEVVKLTKPLKIKGFR